MVNPWMRLWSSWALGELMFYTFTSSTTVSFLLGPYKAHAAPLDARFVDRLRARSLSWLSFRVSGREPGPSVGIQNVT